VKTEITRVKITPPFRYTRAAMFKTAALTVMISVVQPVVPNSVPKTAQIRAIHGYLCGGRA
jgi:hypothetical protein